MFIGYWQAQHFAVARQFEDPCLHDMAPLDGHQRLHRAAVGRGNENLGHVAYLVLVLVDNQLDTVVALPTPGNELASAPNPEVGTGAYLISGIILADHPHAVATSFLGCKGCFSPPIVASGRCCGQQRGILCRPVPVVVAVFGLPPHAVPVVFHKDHGQGYVGHRLAIPIHDQKVNPLLLAHLSQVALRRHARVELGLVNHGRRAVAHLLAIDIGYAGLDGKDLTVGLLGDIGQHLEGRAPLPVRLGVPLGDEAAIAVIVGSITIASPLIVGPTVPGAIHSWRALIVERVVAAQHTPMHVSIGHRAAKVVGCLSADLDGVSIKIALLLRGIGAQRDLELGRFVLGHEKAGADIKVQLLIQDLHVVGTQRGLLVQHQLIV